MIEMETARIDPREPLSYYLGLQYPFNVYADPDGGYVAAFPDLPGCITQVERVEDVSAMVEDARIGWIETEYEQGHAIPLPSYPEEFSGKFNIRIPRSLHRALAEGAERQGISLNQYVVALLSRGDTQARVESQMNAISERLDSLTDMLPSRVVSNQFDLGQPHPHPTFHFRNIESLYSIPRAPSAQPGNSEVGIAV